MSGKDTAAKYGWKIGDRIPINGDIWMPREGQTWFFNIDGIYDGDKTVDKTQFPLPLRLLRREPARRRRAR